MLTWLTASSAAFELSAASAALAGAARERLERLRRPQDRIDFVAARAAAALCVAELTGMPVPEVAFVQRCARCGGGHGPPEVVGAPALAVSWSHSNGWVAAAASDLRSGTTAVGIDIEVPTDRSEIVWEALDDDDTAVVRDACDPWQAFVDLWVRKEAVIKARRLDLDRLRDVDTRSSDVLMVVGCGSPVPSAATAFAALQQVHRRLKPQATS